MGGTACFCPTCPIHSSRLSATRNSLNNIFSYADVSKPIEINLPTMVAKISTPARKSATTNRYSASFSGVGVSPMVVNVSVDQ